MSFELIEITPEILTRINKFLGSKITVGMVPKCFTFPELGAGLCNPLEPLPEPTAVVPKPRLCGLFHICTIYLGEKCEIEKAENMKHQRLVELLLGKGEEDAKDTEDEKSDKQENAVREVEKSEERSPSEDEGSKEAEDIKASEPEEPQPVEKIPEVEKPKRRGRPKKEKEESKEETSKVEEAKPEPEKVEGGSDSPFRANSIPDKIWEYLKTGMYSESEILEHIKSTTGKKAAHYVGYVMTKAKELNVLKEEDDKIGI